METSVVKKARGDGELLTDPGSHLVGGDSWNAVLLTHFFLWCSCVVPGVEV